MPSPLKSPVPTTDQELGTTSIQIDDFTFGPSRSHIDGVALGVEPKPVGLAVAVEVALSDERPRGELRAHPCRRLDRAPSMSHIAMLPSLSRQATSLLPSPLKSWVVVTRLWKLPIAFAAASLNHSVELGPAAIMLGEAGIGRDRVFREIPLWRDTSDFGPARGHVLCGEPQRALGTRGDADRARSIRSPEAEIP